VPFAQLCRARSRANASINRTGRAQTSGRRQAAGISISGSRWWFLSGNSRGRWPGRATSRSRCALVPRHSGCSARGLASGTAAAVRFQPRAASPGQSVRKPDATQSTTPQPQAAAAVAAAGSTVRPTPPCFARQRLARHDAHLPKQPGCRQTPDGR